MQFRHVLCGLVVNINVVADVLVDVAVELLSVDTGDDGVVAFVVHSSLGIIDPGLLWVIIDIVVCWWWRLSNI